MKYSEQLKIGIELAKLIEARNDLSDKKMDRGLSDSDIDYFDYCDNKISKLIKYIEENNEEPDFLIEIGMQHIENEEY